MTLRKIPRIFFWVGLLAAFTLQAAPPDINDTVRFLEQSTWGPNDTQIQQIQSLGGFEAYLQAQFGTAATHYPTPPQVPDDSRQLCPSGSPSSCYRDNYTQYPNQVAFFQHALGGEDQLRQRVAFALHQILVTSGVKITQPAFMAPYLNLLLDDAFGNYRQILQDVTLNPAMGHYLDMVNNRKPSADGKIKPNENYAREIMQLFSIGLNWLNSDGSQQLDKKGQPIPTYDQGTVEGFASTFTGWTYSDPGGNTAGKFPNPHNFADPMVLYRDAKGQDIQHDKTAKTLLALTPGGQAQTLLANQDGLSDLKEALDNLFSHPNIGPFIGKQLIQHLVTSNPSPAYIKRVSDAFNSGKSHGLGSGNRGDMQATIAAILLDSEARCGNRCPAAYGRLREPAQFILNVARAFNANSDGILNSPSSSMGQNIFYSPTVFNYYPHSFNVPGTNLQGPEFGIDASAEAINRENFVNTMVFGHIQPPAPATGTRIDLSALTALASTPTALVDRLDGLLMHGAMPQAMRKTLQATAKDICPIQPKSCAQTALYLVLASGQYQVQR